MLVCTQELNVSLFQLGLTCFYLFLDGISCDNRDAPIGATHLNRHQSELISMIDMFVNILPCRIRCASLRHLTFVQLVPHVQQTFLSRVEHSHLLYDEVLDLHGVPTPSFQFPYLQTLFSVETPNVD